MRHIERSGLFKRQLILFAQDYKNRAGLETAENFLDAVQNAIDFIANKPLACAVYQEASQHDALKGFEFRKWSLSGFPHSVFFRMGENENIKLEAIYAHRMDTMNRLFAELEH